MAIKGIAIDVTKPLKMVKGEKINKATIEDDGRIKATYKDGNAEIYYKRDGFFHGSEEPCSYDLIYDEEQKQETKKRKITDFKVIQGYGDGKTGYFPAIFCLTDDGEIYGAVVKNEYIKWVKLPEIPQD